MRQYIDISPYRDTLGSGTVHINTHLSCIDTSNIMIIYIKTVYLYVVMCDIHNMNIYRDINDGYMKFSLS